MRRRLPRLCGGDVAVPGGESSGCRHGRFLRKHIQSGGKDGAVVQCISKVLLVDQRTASGVDEALPSVFWQAAALTS